MSRLEKLIKVAKILLQKKYYKDVYMFLNQINEEIKCINQYNTK